MALSVAKKDMSVNRTNPYDEIATAFSKDMEAVNTLILDHIGSDVPLVKQIASYLISAGGKRIRPLLTLCFSKLCGDVTLASQQLAAAVEFIHTATLLHDDVVDESDQRRGKASANEAFDNKAPILVGDFLFSRSFQLMVAADNMQALAILADASAVIAQGEVLQLSVLGQLDLPRETYFKVLEGKTAALFAAACESGALVAGANTDQQKAAKDFGLNLGLCFQIIDDVIDYRESSAKTGKSQGDDFREGKITLPVFIAYEQGDTNEKAFWKRVMSDHNQTNEDLSTALAYLKKHDALELSMNIAREFYELSIRNLHVFDDNNIRRQLESLALSTLERDQ